MPKKPRRHPRITEQKQIKSESKYEVIHEFRQCSTSGCKNIISHWSQPEGYSGPIYCVLHRGMAISK